MKGPRSKTVYSEEAAGRLRTGSHYRPLRRPRDSVLVARHANVERPARCTCSCNYAVHQLRPLRTRARSPSLSLYRRPVSSRTVRSLRALCPLFFHSVPSLSFSPLLLGQASGRTPYPFLSLCMRAPSSSGARSLPFSHLLNRASRFRPPLLPPFSLSLSCLSRSFRSASRSDVLRPAVARVRAPSSLPPIIHTHTPA